MKFVKKLIILSGSSKARGTLSLERNAYGYFGTVNIYSLDNLRFGEYRLGLKSPTASTVVDIGDRGRILKRFQLEEVLDFNDLHCVVFNSSEQLPILYGASSPIKLWPANMMDGLRQKASENSNAPVVSEMPKFTARKDLDIKNYFFDITPGARIEAPEIAATATPIASGTSFGALPFSLPQGAVESIADTPDYNDNLLAEVNYYDNEKVESNSLFSSRDDIDKNEILNPVDRYLKELELESTVPWNSEAIASGGGNIYDIENHSVTEYSSKHADTELNTSVVRRGTSLRGGGASGVNGSTNNANNGLGGGVAKGSSVDGTIPMPQIMSLKPSLSVPVPSSYEPTKSASKHKASAIFFEGLTEQLEELLKSNERCKELESLLPETKFVKIQFDSDKYYVVGLIGKKPDYICYGVPAQFSETPPQELGDGCHWLPKNASEPKGGGYWLMFQDAVTGEAE